MTTATRTTVALLSGAAFCSGAAMRVCDALLPRLATDFAITAGMAGQVVIGFSIAYGLMQLVFGPLGDRFGKARVVCAAMFASAAAAAACALAVDFSWLVAARVAWGMAAAGVVPLAIALIGDAVPYAQRQATLAQLLTGTLSGMMAGQLAGGMFADSALGWRGAFSALAAAYALMAFLLLWRLAAVPAAAGTGVRPAFGVQLRGLLGTPWSWVVLATAAAEGIFMLGPLAFLPAYLHLRFGVSLTAASAYIALYAVGGLAYAMVARRLVSRLGERRMVLTGGWLMGLGYLGWWATPIAWLAAPTAGVVGFGTYLLHNTLQTHATQIAPAARGMSVSAFAFCLFAGQALGVTLAGLVFDRWGATPLLLLPALVLPGVGWGFARALKHRSAA